jgi:hypothetical protein
MTVSPAQIIETARSQFGKPYIYASAPDPKVKNPKSFDCSGYTRWVFGRNGVYLPAGSWNQAKHGRNSGTLISIDQAIRTPGALLFMGPNNGYSGYGPSGHVAISLGNGYTAEARGSAHGVGSWNARGRAWTNACLVPGVTYNSPPPNPNAIFKDDLIRKVSALPVIKQGARGFDVKVWQCALNAAIGSHLIGDGSFGPQTDSATRDFQKFWRLTADGIVGPKTRSVMVYNLSIR